MTRPTHLQHSAMSAHTLCGYIAGEGCRTAQEGQTVTCEGCRAVVHFCRETVRIGHIEQSQGDRRHG